MAAQTIRWAGMRLTVEGAAEFQKKLKDVNSQLKISQGELNKVTNAFDKNEQNAETLAAKHQHLTESLRLNAEKQASLNMVLEDATNRYGENSSEVLGLKASLAEAEAQQVQLERALRETERAIQGQSWKELGERLEAAGQRMQAVGDKMQSVGKGLSVGVTAPLVGIGVAALAVGGDFQSSMGTIQARTGMAADEVDKLSRSFRDMAVSGDYGTFTAREIAAAYADIAVKGQDASHGTEIMRTAMVLATAVGNDLGATAYFLGNYLLKVGKDASYAEKYINLFAAANQKTGIGLSTLQDYLFRANVTLQSTNTSGTQATAMFGMLYQAGIRGAQAYSGLENAMRSLLTPTADQIEALERLGVARFYENGQLRDGVPFLLDVAHALGELEGAQLSYYNQLLGSTAMGSAFLGGMVDIKHGLPGMIEELYEASEAVDSTGRAFEMAAIQQNGLIGSNQQIRASLEEIMLQISDHLLPHAQSFLGVVNEWIQRFASLDESTQRNVLRFAAFAAAIGPVLTVSGKLVSTVGVITSSFGALSTAVGAAGGAKAALALKFPVITAGLTAANKATLAKTKATAANTTALTAYTSKLTLASVKMKAFAGGMTTKAAGMGLLKVGLTGATAGFIKLTAAMLANPIGLVIAGVAALGAGIAYLIVRTNRVSEAYQEMAEETARLIERQNELAESSANAALQFQQNIQEMQNQNERTRELADSIERLTGKQELSAGEMETLLHQIAELNNSVPGLTLAYDEQTGALNMTVEALQEYLRAAEKRAAIDAQLEERSRLEREATELVREHAEALKQREALEYELANQSPRRRADIGALENAIRDLKEAEQGYTLALEANAEMQESLTQGIDAYAQALAELERTQNEAAEAIDDTTEAMERQTHTVEEWERAQDEAISRLEQSYQRYYRIASNAFSTVSESAAVSVQELTANLQENARAVEEWSKNIAILTERGVDQGLIQQLRDAGPAAAATVRELVNASDYELDALNTAFEDSTRVALESMKRELDPSGVVQSAGELIDKVAESILTNQSMEDALVSQINTAFGSMDETITTIGFDGLGENTVEGYVQGIENKLPDVEAAGRDTGETYSNALKNSLEQNSPSRVTERIGIGAVDGKVKGVKDNLPQVAEIARTLALVFINGVADKITMSQDIDNATRRQIEDMRRVADMAVMNANFESVGFDMASGVARGIDNGGGIVSNAAQNLINNAISAMQAAAQTSSPSRRTMRLADQLGDGLIIRLRAKGEELAKVCKEITEKVIEGLYVDPSQLIANAQDVLQSMKSALPILESNIRYTTKQPPGGHATTSKAPLYFTLNMNNPVVREEKDINKIAKAVIKALKDDLDYESRIGGIALPL